MMIAHQSAQKKPRGLVGRGAWMVRPFGPERATGYRRTSLAVPPGPSFATKLAVAVPARKFIVPVMVELAVPGPIFVAMNAPVAGLNEVNAQVAPTVAQVS